MLRVAQLFSGDTWILDTAGCQYGFQEVLVPMKKYFAQTSCQRLGEANTYDATETKDLDYFSTLPFMNRTKAQREDRKLERKARLHFAAFVDTVNMDILDGSAAEFRDKLDIFVTDLKVYMLELNN